MIGIASSEAAWRTGLARAGKNQQEWVEDVRRVAEQATEDRPRLRELVAHYQTVDVQASMDEDFDYGLERVLDGLQVRLDSLTS